MKKVIIIVAFIAIVMMGCTTLNAPALIGDGNVGSKTGQSSGTIILGIWGDVDAGMITAARNAGITRIGAVDFQVSRVLGTILTTYTTTVTGD